MPREFSRRTEDAIREVRDVFNVMCSGETREVAAALTTAVMIRLSSDTRADVLANPKADPAQRNQR